MALDDYLENRRLYLRSMAEIQGLVSDPDALRWLKINMWQIKPDGAIDKEKGPTRTFSDFIMQTVSHMDRERLQMVAGVRDNSKIYFFDREIRQFSIQGFVYDMPYDAKQAAAGLQPFAFSKLRTAYDEQLRTSAAFRKKLIAELDYGQFRIYGTFSNMSSTLTSDSPTIYVVSFVMTVEAVEVKPNMMPAPQPATAGATPELAAFLRRAASSMFVPKNIDQPLFGLQHAEDVLGILSKEGAAKVGLTDPKNLPVTLPTGIELTHGVEKTLREDVSYKLRTIGTGQDAVPGLVPVLPRRKARLAL